MWPGTLKPDLIFFDPPYYKKREAEYGEQSISALSRAEYLSFWAEWGVLAHAKSKPNTRLALLTANWRDFQSTSALDESPEEAVTMFDYWTSMTKAGWELTHQIDVPLSSERFTGQMVSAMQGKRILGTTNRNLLMFRRKG